MTEPPPLPPGTFSVPQLHAELGIAVNRAFPDEVWVAGEVQSKRQAASGHVYLDLVTRAEAHAPPTASLKVICKAAVLARVRAELAGTGVRVEDGVEVRLRGRVTTYPAQGVFQLQMSGIDPVFTLGRIAASRDAVLQELQREGLLGLQQQLVCPQPPLRVALITSAGSAAYHDFCDELQQSEFSFQIVAYDVRVQGADAPRLLTAALARAQRSWGGWVPELIVLTRGGGARTDLAAFDDVGLARAIASCPIPVLVGVGHEIDTSIADAVAFVACKTPTAAAGWVLARARDAAAALAEGRARLLRAGTGALDLVETELQRGGSAVARSAERQLFESSARLEAGTTRIAAAAETLAGGFAARVERDQARLQLAAPAVLHALEERLTHSAALVAAHDPARVLERGFSLTRSLSGELLRTTPTPGTRIQTQIAAGTFTSEVES